MGSVIDITKIPRGTPGKIDAHLLGDVGEDVRQFLRTTWLGEDTHADEEGLQAGRDLIEDFAMRAAALRDNQEGAEYGQDIPLAEVALVLRYLKMVMVKDGCECYGHAGGASACGYNQVLSWLQRNVERHASRDDDSDDAA